MERDLAGKQLRGSLHPPVEKVAPRSAPGGKFGIHGGFRRLRVQKQRKGRERRVVIADRPDSLQVEELLVRAYLVQGKVAQATDQLERLLEVVASGGSCDAQCERSGLQDVDPSAVIQGPLHVLRALQVAFDLQRDRGYFARHRVRDGRLLT